MPAGRPRKPTPLRKLEGNAGKRPLNENEPQPTPVDVEGLVTPEWIESDPDAIYLWNTVAPELARLGLLTVIDVPLLSAACERWSLYRRSSRRLRSLTMRTKANGATKRPEVEISNQALSIIRQILADFGVGPAHRTRLGVPDAAPPDPRAGAQGFLDSKPRRNA